MKEVKTYICGICGAQYNDKRKCEFCENFHKKPIEIVGAKHYCVESKSMGYPVIVNIKMSNGSVIAYKPCWEE